MLDDIEQEVAESEGPAIGKEEDESEFFESEEDELGNEVSGKEEQSSNESESEQQEQESSQESNQEQQTESETNDTDESNESDETEEEDDEDLIRGKSLLEAEQKAEEDRQKKEREEQDQRQQQEQPQNQLVGERFDHQHFEALRSHIPKNLFPNEPVKLSDGTELDFKSLVTDYPELPYYVSAMANNLIRQMAASGFLVSGESSQKQLTNINETIDKRNFVRTVTHPEYGVPKAHEISESQEFKEWYPKQPAEIQALGKSENPWDHIRMFRRFLKQSVIDKADQANNETDANRQEKKKKVNSALKAPDKSQKRRQPAPKKDDPDDERAAFESKDDDDDI